MPLYLGDSDKLKVILDDIEYRFYILSESSFVTNGIRLLSSDDYTLKDSNGLFLTVKESE